MTRARLLVLFLAVSCNGGGDTDPAHDASTDGIDASTDGIDASTDRIDASTDSDAATADDAARPDADDGVDALVGTKVTIVECAAVEIAAEVQYVDDVLTPKTTTIAIGEVVRFHSLGDHTAWHTAGLFSATSDEELCLRFDGAGDYPFYCYFHPGTENDTGTVSVAGD